MGTFQKNTELLLETLAAVDLGEWQVRLIGPVETCFEAYRDAFFKQHPHLRKSITFTGNIADPEQLTAEYRQASVFLFTSRFESSGLVLLEAALNGCYILTTDVGSARDISAAEGFCFISPESKTDAQNEAVIRLSLAAQLQAIIDGTVPYTEKLGKQIETCQERFLMSRIILQDCFKKWISC